MLTTGHRGKKMKVKIIGLFVCMLLIAVAFPTTGLVNNQPQSGISYGSDPHILKLIRIDTTKGLVSLPRGTDIVGHKPGEWVDIILTQEELNLLIEREVDLSILIEDVNAHSASVRGTYHSLADVESMLQSIAENYTSITSLYSIGTTYEGRDIWCLEITDNPGVDEGEPGVFFMGLHHAREWPTIEVCLYIADQLTSQYGVDPDITDAVNNRRLWLVTCVNPDGYYYCHDSPGYDWRQNRHYFPQFGTYGVDLNRNYGGSSNGDPWGSWGSIGAGSVTHNPDYEIYCGPGSISELETQTIRDMFLTNDICATISWHTHGELVIWPWGYSASEQTPDNTYLSYVGQQIASRISKQTSGTYEPGQSAGLYPTTGDTTDWAYGYAHYVQGRPTFAYTIEACNEFQPPASALDQIVQENFDGALYFLQEAENISNVIPRVIPPVIDDMTEDNDGDYTVSWQEQNPAANPDYFQLDELTGITIDTDDAESGTGLWALDGFSLSTSRSYSSSHSYKSRYSDEDVSSMTTTYPIPITAGMTLSLWTWYNIEEDWDYAFVEVSRDGRFYDLLESFTGSSGGWILKSYSLDDYADDSLFIRFRYTTDTYTQEEGFYVDDISPVADIASITTLSSSIPTTYYGVTGKTEGTYYYRVRGYNNEHGWGDFSTLEKIEVIAPSIPDPDLSYVTLTGGVGMHPSLQSQYAEWYPFTVTVIDTGGQPIQGIPAGDFSFTASLGTNTFSHCELNSYLEWDPLDAQTNVNGEIQFRVRALTSIGADTLDPTPNGGFITIVATVSSVELNDSDDLLVSSCDIDIDGDVDLSDFSRFAVDFGLNRQRSDFDFDFGVDLSDFSKFAVEFGARQIC